MDELKKAFEQISSASDAATLLIAGTAGFFIGGLETGFVSGSGALGIKKGIDASIAKWRERKAQKQMPDKERARAQKLLEKLSIYESDRQCRAIARRLKTDLELFESGVIKADDLKAGIDEAIKAYRDHSLNQEDSS